MAGRNGVTHFTSLGIERLFTIGTASSDATGTSGQVLTSGGSSSAVSWAALNSSTLPVASSSQSGIVSTGTQSFIGSKNFLSDLRVRSGTLSALSVIFSADQDTGFYRSADNTFTIAAGGTGGLSVSNVAVTGLKPFRADDGSNSSPSFSFTSETDMGFYRPGSGGIGWTVGGAQKGQFTATQTQSLVPIVAPDGSVGTPSISFTNEPDTGLYIIGTNNIGITAGGILGLDYNSSRVKMSVPVYAADGVVTAPSYAFNSESTAGLYRVAAGSYRFVGNSATTLQLNLFNNNSSGNAVHAVTVAGTSAGDPVHLWSVTSGASVSMGLDNSDSDKLKICWAGNLTGNPYFVLDENGAFTLSDSTAQIRNHTIYGGSLYLQGSGETNYFVATSSTTDSPKFGASVPSAATTADPKAFWAKGPQYWVAGLDSSDSNTFKIAYNTSAVLGSNDSFQLTTSGKYTLAAADNAQTHVWNGKAWQFKLPSTGSDSGQMYFYGQSTTHGSLNFYMDIAAGNTTADAYNVWAISGGTTWIAGLDNSDSDAWALSLGALGGTNVLKFDTNGYPYFPQHTTTASAANAFLDSSTGQLLRSTSSLRYKEEVVDLVEEIDSSKIYDLKPISFTDKTSKSRHFGLAAEQVAEVLPSLVQYGPETLLDPAGDPTKQIPDGVQYSLLSVLLLEEVRKLKAKIEALEKNK